MMEKTAKHALRDLVTASLAEESARRAVTQAKAKGRPTAFVVKLEALLATEKSRLDGASQAFVEAYQKCKTTE
jgi:hypothetical protein